MRGDTSSRHVFSVYSPLRAEACQLMWRGSSPGT